MIKPLIYTDLTLSILEVLLTHPDPIHCAALAREIDKHTGPTYKALMRLCTRGWAVRTYAPVPLAFMFELTPEGRREAEEVFRHRSLRKPGHA